MKGLNLFTLVLIVLVYACTEPSKTSESPKKEKKKFEMYEQSEMAALMLQMYSFSEQLKAKIEAGEEELPAYPEHFERLFEAELTDGKTRDEFFIQHAEIFLTSQMSIHNAEANQKEAFNTMVNKCIECHQQKCTGPIPKIEKLYIAD